MKIAKIKDVKTPSRGTSRSAGIDFYIPNDFNNGNCFELKSLERINIPSGIKVKVPSGFALIGFNKSGVSTKKGLKVGACVIDEDYQGEIHLSLFNDSNEIVVLNPGEKIVQFLLVPQFYDDIEEVDVNLLYNNITERGENGFGSTN